MFEYLTFSLPTTILIFFIYRIVYHLIRQYEIAKHLKKFSLHWFLFILLLEGQIIYTSYIVFNHFQLTFFSLNFNSKMMNLACVLLGFLMIVYTFASSLLVYWHYKRRVKYLND